MSDNENNPEVESSEEAVDSSGLQEIPMVAYEGEVDDDEGPVGDGPIEDDDEPNDDDDEEKEDEPKEDEPEPPKIKKVPTRAPPVPPPRACDVPTDTWSSKPVSNRVWEVDEEEEYEQEAEPEFDFSDTPLIKDYDIGKELGRGFFATASVVTEKSSGTKYAVKVNDNF